MASKKKAEKCPRKPGQSPGHQIRNEIDLEVLRCRWKKLGRIIAKREKKK